MPMNDRKTLFFEAIAFSSCKQFKLAARLADLQRLLRCRIDCGHGLLDQFIQRIQPERREHLP